MRENHIDVARFLLLRDTNPMDLWVDDAAIEIARAPARRQSIRRKLGKCAVGVTRVASGQEDGGGADINARDEHLQSTPLAWAAKFGQAKMVKFLLKRGAPKSLPDDPAWATPRAWALRRGHPKVAKLL